MKFLAVISLALAIGSISANPAPNNTVAQNGIIGERQGDVQIWGDGDNGNIPDDCPSEHMKLDLGEAVKNVVCAIACLEHTIHIGGVVGKGELHLLDRKLQNRLVVLDRLGIVRSFKNRDF